MEREVLLTGIGGQGVQLAARTLAVAAMDEGREVRLFGSYGGMMRGGNTDATLVVSDGALTAPPTVSRCWAALAMHPDYWPPVRDRIRPGGFALTDASVFGEPVAVEGCTVLGVEATKTAADMGAPAAGSMVAIGAFAAATGLVSREALEGATAKVLPSYRSAHAANNARAVAAGFAMVDGVMVDAWPSATAASETVGARQ